MRDKCGADPEVLVGATSGVLGGKCRSMRRVSIDIPSLPSGRGLGGARLPLQKKMNFSLEIACFGSASFAGLTRCLAHDPSAFQNVTRARKNKLIVGASSDNKRLKAVITKLNVDVFI